MQCFGVAKIVAFLGICIKEAFCIYQYLQKSHQCKKDYNPPIRHSFLCINIQMFTKVREWFNLKTFDGSDFHIIAARSEFFDQRTLISRFGLVCSSSVTMSMKTKALKIQLTIYRCKHRYYLKFTVKVDLRTHRYCESGAEKRT